MVVTGGGADTSAVVMGGGLSTPTVVKTLVPPDVAPETGGNELVGKGATKVLLVSVVDKLVFATGVTKGENIVGETDATTIGATFSEPTKLTCRGASGSSKLPLPMLPVPISMRL